MSSRTKHLDVTYTAGTAGAPITSEVIEVLYPDKLRAEQAAVRAKLPTIKDAPLTGMSLWAWAALRRLGRITTDPAPFLNLQLLDVDPVEPVEPDDEDADDEGAAAGAWSADPTRPGPSTD